MKKIILNLIILAAIITGYIAYQKYNNQQMIQFHDQLNDVKIQESSDGGSCTDDSDCDSGDCDTSTDTCKGNCADLLDGCTVDGDCCHDYYCDTATSTCGSDIGIATVSAGLTAALTTAANNYNSTGSIKGTTSSTGGTSSTGVEYDANGNMTYDPSDLNTEDTDSAIKAKRSSSKKRPRKKNNLGSNYHGPREANVGINRTKPIETIQSVARKNAGKDIEEALEVAVETGS